MKEMEEKILKEGRILPGDVLKVGSFLNQRLDTEFLFKMGEEVARLFEDAGVNKIVTIEASGIAFAMAIAYHMRVPVVFAKKKKSANVGDAVYTATVRSYTYNRTYEAVIDKEYLSAEDKVLLVDDFLATGEALLGLSKLIRSAGAEVAGAAIAIEKKYQKGGDILREQGIRVESLAIIESMTDDSLTFYR